MKLRWVSIFLVGGFLFWTSISLWPGTAVAEPFLAPDSPVGTGFTYQGQLKQSGSVVTSNCDMAFRAFDQSSGGAQVGNPITQTVTVNNGLFTTNLDWGSAVFNGEARWLDIRLRCPTGSGAFAPLSPRQNLTPAPYALHALNADYANVVVVAQSGGDFTSIQAALDSITDNSASQRYLVWIAPGDYIEQVTMKPYVDIEGAGREQTWIKFLSSTASEDTGTVIGADNAELRHISVYGGNLTASAFAVAMYNNNVSPRLRDVGLTAFVVSTANGYAILNRNGASPLMEDVTAFVDGSGNIHIGVYNDANSSPMMNRVTVNASLANDNRGVYNKNGSNPTIIDVSAITDVGTNAFNNRAIYNNNASPTLRNVTALAANATQNYALHNENSSLPTVVGGDFSASGGNLSYGLRLRTGSGVIMDGGRISASGSVGNFGVFLTENSFLDMTQTVVEAIGIGRGIQFENSDGELDGVKVTATDGEGIYNLANGGVYEVYINQSQIRASLNTIRNDSEFFTRVGASLLWGGDTQFNGGIISCAGTYDENYIFYDVFCP